MPYTMSEKKRSPWIKRINALKRKLKLNNTELAARMGVSVSTVRSWLYRNQLPSDMAQAFIAELESK